MQGQRNHWHWGLLQNPVQATLELVDLPVSGQFAFGEDAHQFTVFQVFSNFLEGLIVDRQVFVAPGNRDGASGAKNEVEHRQVVDFVIHHEPNRPPHSPANQQRIDKGHMVADQQRRTLVRNQLQVAMLDTVHGMAEQPDHEAHGELGHDLEDVGIHRDVHQRDHQKQLRNRQFDHAEEHDRDDGRHHHEQRIEDIVGSNDPRTFVLGGARLDQRVQRYDIEAAKNTDAQHIAQHPPRLTIRQHRQPVIGLNVLRKAARMPPQQQPEHGQAHRAKRHQADLDLAPGQPLAQHRTQRDADGEHGENQRDHGLVAIQPLFGVGRNLRQVNRADEPEPGVTDNRA